MTGANLWALGLLVIGLMLLWIFLIRLIRRLTFKPVEGKKVQPPASVSFLAIMFAVILLIFSWSLFWIGHQLRSFKCFNYPGMVGRIDVINEHDPLKTLKVDFYSVARDGIGKPTSFYLTGNAIQIYGQFIELPGFLKLVFDGTYFCKVTDFRGKYIGHKPPGYESVLFEHQEIGGGRIDVFEYITLVPLIKMVFKVCEFESAPLEIKNKGVFDVVLTDGCFVSMLKAH